MMRPLLALCLLATLSGCYSRNFLKEAWNYEPASELASARVPVEDARADELKRKAAELRGQAAAVRAKLDGTLTPAQRVPLYRELDAIGWQLSQTERRLVLAGRAAE